MPDTYSKIYIQIIFAVKNRSALISPSWESDLFKYITGIVKKDDQKMLAINGVRNHIHFLIGMNPTCRLSDLVREIKKSSNQFINDKGYYPFKFEWQRGYGAFSYSRASLDNVIAYIHNQKEHHRKVSFQEEYIKFLNDFQIDYKEEYLFDWDVK